MSSEKSKNRKKTRKNTRLSIEYTVIGDSINLSSRLEGLTKLVDALIVCSSSTINSLSEDFNYNHRFLLKIKVKGRMKPVN